MPAHRKLTAQLLANELAFVTSRSGGPGGQNVNKVSSKVTLQFDVRNSAVLTDDEKQKVLDRLKSRINREGLLSITAQDNRSQLANKNAAIARFEVLLNKALEGRKARKVTKPSRRAAEERIREKKQKGEKKRWRQKPE